jgi:N-acetylmuramic acid 6-phosphate etherase
MPVTDIVDLITAEDRRVVTAVHRERERIAHGVEILVNALKKGGRIFLVGAGTSGRLGVLEAAEMPPTFGTPPTLVQAIMAGGQEAVFRAREGVEDNFEEGARSISRVRVTRRDVIIGVSASGFAVCVAHWSEAARSGARIIFVTCWPGTELQNYVDLIIAPVVGAEVIAGSTRLKAGTATKMVLNMLTTITMIRVGKTCGNLMVDVQTGSEKLRDRAPHRGDHPRRSGRGRRVPPPREMECEGRDRDEEGRRHAAAGAAQAPQRRRLDSQGPWRRPGTDASQTARRLRRSVLKHRGPAADFDRQADRTLDGFYR